MQDVLGQEIKVDDNVIFAENIEKNTPRLLEGTVSDVKEKHICVKTMDGEEHVIRLSRSRYYDNTKINVSVVMHDRAKRSGEFKDFTGYPVEVGDSVVYMGESYQGKCYTLVPGKVVKITAQYAYFEVEDALSYREFISEPRRKSERFVVL